MLPDVIKQTGVTTRKRSPDILMCVNVISPHGRYDQLYLSNYAADADPRRAAPPAGVSDIFLFGQRDYSMRIWVDPDKLAVAEPDGRRRGGRACASRTRRWPRARSASSRCRRGRRRRSPLTTLGRLKRAGAVRQHHPPRHARRPHHPHQGRRPRGPGGQERGRRAAAATASRRRAWPSSSCPTPTPWRWPTPSARRWRS